MNNGEVQQKITLATITEFTNKPAPNILPIAKDIPSESPLPPAIIAVSTSGAPFPKANKVTPANVQEHFRNSEILVRDGDKYFSAVDYKR
ncbi:hypothetical protein IMG5_105270 [Ichthyophthirius multifiliis]|uniref:Uncharacterized protein n=1 Tax=Ichthyophthirius multifiliis TaxID=5932 RepID=G0QT07_ICHMU|nr:hypothetical protein IMG5_105270 [Ichthyophthirius multifiliis]EGR31642.1 hypothetical protein IMG5_105270 [Ichthyophthirius multifiliis]|eukprot:XP_004035128.1 hypothetical protein IMG5_105270 [Ichthyophthirius multifiliis]